MRYYVYISKQDEEDTDPDGGVRVTPAGSAWEYRGDGIDDGGLMHFVCKKTGAAIRVTPEEATKDFYPKEATR